jgi:hypothetical protein
VRGRRRAVAAAVARAACAAAGGGDARLGVCGVEDAGAPQLVADRQQCQALQRPRRGGRERLHGAGDVAEA